MQLSKTIRYAPGIPVDFNQLLELYSSVEWTRYTKAPEKLSQALENSSYIICAYAGDQLIGLVRGLSDKVAIHFIQDLLVHPDYQKQGMGSTLLQKAVSLYPGIRKHVLLTDDESSVKEFYSHQGFQNTTDVRPKMNVFIKWTTER